MMDTLLLFVGISDWTEMITLVKLALSHKGNYYTVCIGLSYLFLTGRWTSCLKHTKYNT